MTSLFTTTESRFHALQTRNPLASYSFVYCVLTTKIYCRPTCPSRLARRANILFHNTASEAATAGFRPCKRCRPDDSEGGLDQQVLMIRKACRLIDREEVGSGQGKWPVKGLAREVGLTESHFCRVFRKVTGGTVGDYRRSVQGKSKGQLQMEVLSRSSDPTITPGKKITQDKGVFNGAINSTPNNLDFHTTTSELPEMSTFGNSFIEFDFSTCQYDILGDGIPFSAREGTDDFSEFLDFGSPPPLNLPI